VICSSCCYYLIQDKGTSSHLHAFLPAPKIINIINIIKKKVSLRKLSKLLAPPPPPKKPKRGKGAKAAYKAALARHATALAEAQEALTPLPF